MCMGISKCSKYVCSGEIPEVKFKAQPDKVKKDIKIQKWVFMSFFAFWEFS